MSLVFRAGICARLAVLLVVAGCRLPKAAERPDSALASAAAGSRQQARVTPSRTVDTSTASAAAAVRPASPIQQVVHRLPEAVPADFPDDGIFTGQQELSLPQLLAEVEAQPVVAGDGLCLAGDGPALSTGGFAGRPDVHDHDGPGIIWIQHG